MNGNTKFHKPESPAFYPGEVWVSAEGKHRVTVVSVRRWGNDRWDADVTFSFTEAGEVRESHKDCWNFQVRYSHIADLVL